MKHIYLAVSDSFPGQFKIGRTSREVDVRMAELSEDNYGPTGFAGDSEWRPHAIFEVDDEIEAEAFLHEFFQSDRLEARRELFAADDAEVLTEQVFEVLSSEGMLIGFAEVAHFGTTGYLLAGAALLAVTYAGVTIFVNYTPNQEFASDISAWVNAKEKAFNDWGQKQKRPLLNLPSRRIYRLGLMAKSTGEYLGEGKLFKDERVLSAIKIAKEGLQTVERHLSPQFKKAITELKKVAASNSESLNRLVYDADLPTELKKAISDLDKLLNKD